MNILPVTNPAFRAYGQILHGYDFSALKDTMKHQTPIPAEGTVYMPSLPALEALSIAEELRSRGFGGLDIQIGYCNGTNFQLTCLEYHRTSEIDIACDDMILLLARQEEMAPDYTLDTSNVCAFFVPEGTGVELFATTLHYAPCGGAAGQSFRMCCVLPRGTNTAKPEGVSGDGESALLAGKNKWVIAGSDTDEAAAGGFVGLHGPEICLFR